MPIYKSKVPTKDGRAWYYKISVTDIFGTNKQVVSKKYSTKTEAKMEEAKFLNEKSNDTNAPIDMTFRQLYSKYIEYQDDKVKITTKTNYRNKVAHLESILDMKCKDFTIDVFEAWKKEINNKPELSTITKNDILKFLKSLLNYAMDWYNYDFTSLYRKITNFTNPNEMKKEMAFYTYEEFKIYIQVEEDLKYKCLWETLYYCGLRCGEARGLTWDSINFKNKTLKINKQVLNNKIDGSWYITSPKTRDSNRTIPICDVLFEDLKNLYEIESKPRNFNPGFYVFGSDHGMTPFGPSSVRDRNKKNSIKAGLKYIRLHDFRHSCASLLINSGASVTMVAKYLGHTKIDVTLNTYSHMFQSALDSVIEIINGINNQNT